MTRVSVNRASKPTGQEGSIGSARWLAIHDELLRGVTHALSNRLGTFEAFTSQLEHSGALDRRLTEALRGDVEDLHRLLGLFRLLPRREDVTAEPTLITDAVELAIPLVMQHQKLRAAAITVECIGEIPPVWSDPTALVHAISVAILAACTDSTSVPQLIVILTTTDGEVALRVERVEKRVGRDGEEVTASSGADVLADDAAAIDWLLGSSGGAAGGDCLCEVRVPTLAAHIRAHG